MSLLSSALTAYNLCCVAAHAARKLASEGRPQCSDHQAPSASQGSSRDGEAAAAALPRYYRILGVGLDATASDVARGYRNMAGKWHPDKWVASADKMEARTHDRAAVLPRAIFWRARVAYRWRMLRCCDWAAFPSTGGGQPLPPRLRGVRNTATPTEAGGVRCAICVRRCAEQRGQLEH